MDIISVFETEGGSSILSRPANKEIVMKEKIFENIFNHDRVVCNNVRETEVIEGVEYLIVRRPGSDRPFLMRKDSLKEIKK